LELVTKKKQVLRRLEEMYATLENIQGDHPERNAVIPATDAERFNEILFDAIDVLGEGYVRMARIYQQMYIPVSEMYPVESVGLSGMLVSIRDVLRKPHTIEPA
jgi:hypothetical protein